MEELLRNSLNNVKNVYEDFADAMVETCRRYHATEHLFSVLSSHPEWTTDDVQVYVTENIMGIKPAAALSDKKQHLA